MTRLDRRFWPFRPLLGLIAVPFVVVSLLVIVALVRATLGWPDKNADTVVLVGVLVVSLLPIVVAFLDLFIERGGVIEYRGVKIDLSPTKERATPGLALAGNIGAPGVPMTDSSTLQILDALRAATHTEVVIIDLEDGKAWWETRLLVVLAGAVRLGRPDKIVFVAKDANIDRQFQGWSYATDLLPHLIAAHPQYARSVDAAQGAARQWALVEPTSPPDPSAPAAAVPTKPAWIQGGLAESHAWMAFDPTTGLPNELFAEQVLQSDLGQKIEAKGGPRNVTLARIEELFRPVLVRQSIDLGWPSERQLETFLGLDAAFVALTRNGEYSAIASRAVLANEVLKSLAGAQSKVH
jgi:hypothetical protein